MAKVLVLRHSTYGHIETTVGEVAAGAREAGAEVTMRRVPELVSDEIAAASGCKPDHAVPVATVDELGDDDAIVVGAGTRYGRMPSQFAAFLDQTRPLWARGAFVGKVGAAFTSTGIQHGGQETTLFSTITNLFHFGMTIVGLDYGFAGQMGTDEVRGGAPYGATTIASGDGKREVHQEEKDAARYLGRRVANVAKVMA